MSRYSAPLSLGFSCVAHSYSHVFGPVFFVVVLALESQFGISHGDAVALILVGNMLFGVAAPLSGWLGDRWSAVGMMALFFLGTGGGMVMTGLAPTPFMIAFGLAVTGLFASIYHPVGMAWLVRNARNRGFALGASGVFGGFGPAFAALVSGAFIDLFGWRSAFLLPGALIVATGIVFVVLVATGVLVETKQDIRADAPASRSDTLRVIGVLALTMICNGLIYQATQAGLPKLFSVRLFDFATGGALRISATVALVYAGAGFTQLVTGHLADRYPLKTVYQIGFLTQAPFLFLAATMGGSGLIVVAFLMLAANSGTLPAENCLVARYAPSNLRGFAYGLKFIVAFGLGSLGVLLEGTLFDATGDYFWLFTVLGSLAVAASAIAFLLPSERSTGGAGASQPAE